MLAVTEKDGEYGYYTIEGETAERWRGKADELPEGIVCVTDDVHPLFGKITASARFRPIVNEKGVLTDVEELEPVPYEPTVAEKIAAVQAELASTDYQALKYAEGLYTEEQYAPIKERRLDLRGRMNAMREEG
jgi:hypothetical protein